MDDMQDKKHSIRFPYWLEELVSDWCDIHDTTVSRLVRKALEKFFMAEKHSKHVRCDLINTNGVIRIVPNPEGKWFVSLTANQETLLELWERATKNA